MAGRFFNSDLNGKTVFNIGFGFAQALIFLKNKGLEVSGLEPSIEGVEHAKANGISNAYHTGIENYNVAGDQKFDLVLLLNVLEHLREPEKTVRNIKKDLLSPKEVPPQICTAV